VNDEENQRHSQRYSPSTHTPTHISTSPPPPTPVHTTAYQSDTHPERSRSQAIHHSTSPHAELTTPLPSEERVVHTHSFTLAEALQEKLSHQRSPTSSKARPKASRDKTDTGRSEKKRHPSPYMITKSPSTFSKDTHIDKSEKSGDGRESGHARPTLKKSLSERNHRDISATRSPIERQSTGEGRSGSRQRERGNGTPKANATASATSTAAGTAGRPSLPKVSSRSRAESPNIAAKSSKSTKDNINIDKEKDNKERSSESRGGGGGGRPRGGLTNSLL
jgi:hypothetical protein